LAQLTDEYTVIAAVIIYLFILTVVHIVRMNKNMKFKKPLRQFTRKREIITTLVEHISALNKQYINTTVSKTTQLSRRIPCCLANE